MFERRRGVSIVESLVAMVLIGVVTVAVARLLGPVARLQRASQRRQIAVSELANFAEGLTKLDYDELTPTWAESRRLSDSTQASLPGASFRVNLIDVNTRPLGKQVRIELDWRTHSGETVEPIRLVAWKFNSRKASP